LPLRLLEEVEGKREKWLLLQQGYNDIVDTKEKVSVII
jgi:hypothetical protein